MKRRSNKEVTRRFFMRYLTAGPLLGYGATRSLSGVHSLFGSQIEELIRSPQEAINVFDFQNVAKAILPPAHYGYLATGVDDDFTLQANREGFKKFHLRVRRLIDVRTIDTSVEIFGSRWETPIVLAPVGNQRAFHPEGEIPVARAAQTRSHLQILSTVTNTSVEDITETTGAPVWYQLYPTHDWSITKSLLRRAEAAGCPVVVLTVDQQGGSNRETAARLRKLDTRQCNMCHSQEIKFRAWVKTNKPGFWPPGVERKPMFSGLDVSQVRSGSPSGMTWDLVHRLKEATSMRLFIKGIVTGEDAQLCLENGVDGIIISNHGGRAEESGRSTIECLPEVVKTVDRRIPVLIDGGFRRGTDIFKALALGANAICIGRPYIWGLAAFGQAGVEAVLDILRAELELVMRQAGATSVDKVTSTYIGS